MLMRGKPFRAWSRFAKRRRVFQADVAESSNGKTSKER
jgi:hypothetical protein